MQTAQHEQVCIEDLHPAVSCGTGSEQLYLEERMPACARFEQLCAKVFHSEAESRYPRLLEVSKDQG